MARRLTAQQLRFVEHYAGNATEAARLAGYKHPMQLGCSLLARPHVAAAIRARDAEASARRIATREERQRFWTRTMNDAAQDMAARLKASALLGKSQGDFMLRVEHTGKDGQPIRHEHTVALSPELEALVNAALGRVQ